MHKADYNKISFDHKEIVLVNTLVSKEFKSVDFCENIKIKTKINELCYKFRVSSFEELVRIIIFYKLFDIDISDEYYEYIESYSREKISIQIYTRNIILDIAKNTSEIFSDFCNSFPLIGLEEYKDKLDEYINIINSDNETIHSINHIRDFINLVNNKHDFEQIFDIVFDLDDIEYIEDPQEEISKLIVPAGKDGILVSTAQVGTFRRKEWEIQQESRFKINVQPVNMAGAINEMVNKKDYKPYEILMSIFESLGPCIANNKPIDTTHIDLDIDSSKLANVEIMLGPLTSEADRIIVESLLSQIPSAKVVDSVFRGKLRDKDVF